MPLTGFEPVRYHYRGILSPLRPASFATGAYRSRRINKYCCRIFLKNLLNTSNMAPPLGIEPRPTPSEGSRFRVSRANHYTTGEYLYFIPFFIRIRINIFFSFWQICRRTPFCYSFIAYAINLSYFYKWHFSNHFL